MKYSNFNDFLHDLRSQQLRRIPAGAEVFLSAGCSGRWYFDWIHENYPGVTRHLGIEAYSPKPADLPEGAYWLPDYIYDMRSVANEEADLVFAGQTIEHLWPEQLTGFLRESHRVLKPDGLLVLDSPNQLITKALHWHQPEHTMELTVAEIRDLVTLAGFHDITVRGIWLCRDGEPNRLMPLIPDLDRTDSETDIRVTSAAARPEDCFIWWLEARKTASAVPDIQAISSRAASIFDREYARALRRVFSQTGNIEETRNGRVIQEASLGNLRNLASGVFHDLRSALGGLRAAWKRRFGEWVGARKAGLATPGYLRHGPYMPLKRGNYLVRFGVSAAEHTLRANQNPSALVGNLDVCADNGTRILAHKDLHIADILAPASQAGLPQELSFSIQDVAFGVEFRVFTTGLVPLTVQADVELVAL